MGDLKGFLDGVEAEMQSNPPPWHIFRPPAMARDEGANEPPARLDDPVWTPETGWAEKADITPRHFIWADGSIPE